MGTGTLRRHREAIARLRQDEANKEIQEAVKAVEPVVEAPTVEVAPEPPKKPKKPTAIEEPANEPKIE